jgi:hypothetical protein
LLIFIFVSFFQEFEFFFEFLDPPFLFGFSEERGLSRMQVLPSLGPSSGALYFALLPSAGDSHLKL